MDDVLVLGRLVVLMVGLGFHAPALQAARVGDQLRLQLLSKEGGSGTGRGKGRGPGRRGRRSEDRTWPVRCCGAFASSAGRPTARPPCSTARRPPPTPPLATPLRPSVTLGRLTAPSSISLSLFPPSSTLGPPTASLLGRLGRGGIGAGLGGGGAALLADGGARVELLLQRRPLLLPLPGCVQALQSPCGDFPMKRGGGEDTRMWCRDGRGRALSLAVMWT